MGAVSFDPGDKAIVRKTIVNHAVSEGLAELSRQLDPQNPSSVDMIMFVPTHKCHVPGIDDYVQKGRNRVFREGMPIGVAPTTLLGSGNVYWEAMALLQDQLGREDFLTKYPQLRGRSIDSIRVMFVFVDNNDYRQNLVLDEALINGYRVAAKVRESTPSSEGGQIIVYSRDVYIGPMFKFSGKDINFMGNWVTKDELKTLGMPEMNPDGGDNSVKWVNEKPDITGLEQQSNGGSYQHKMLLHLRKHYDLSKNRLRQFPALSGIMVFNARTVRLLDYVVRALRRNPEIWSSLPRIHMISDIINLLLKPKNEIQRDYLEERIDLPDVKNPDRSKKQEDIDRQNYRAYFDLFIQAKEDLGNDFKADIVIPAQGMSELIHVKDRTLMNEAVALLRSAGLDQAEAGVLQAPDLAQDDTQRQRMSGGRYSVPNENGGIDLSTAREGIEFRKEEMSGVDGPAKVFSGHSYQFLQLFRGFDFRISAFQPLEDPRMFLGL